MCICTHVRVKSNRISNQHTHVYMYMLEYMQHNTAHQSSWTRGQRYSTHRRPRQASKKDVQTNIKRHMRGLAFQAIDEVIRAIVTAMVGPATLPALTVTHLPQHLNMLELLTMKQSLAEHVFLQHALSAYFYA